MKQFYEQNKIEVGIDEAGRGCLFGPVCIAAVIWLDEDPIKDDKDYEIKDIQKIEEEKIVYNIQVNSIYTFFANGYLVHNGSDNCPNDDCLACYNA